METLAPFHRQIIADYLLVADVRVLHIRRAGLRRAGCHAAA
jgi:uncharacterized protein (DUF488 family)